MVELEDFDEEFVSKLQELSKDVISIIDNEFDGELPTRSVYVAEEGTIVEKDIEWPGRILNQYRSEISEPLRETAEWMEDNPDRSYRPETVIDPFRSESQPVTNDFIQNPSDKHLIATFEMYLFEIVEDVINRGEKLEYDDEAFTEAAKRHLINTSYMGPLGRISEEYKVVFPLLNFALSGEALELDADVRIIDRFDREWISHIELSELTAQELAGIYTFEGSRKFRGSRTAFNDASHGLKISMNGSASASHDDQVRAAIISGLRLFKQESPEVHGGPGYRMRPGALSHRENISNVCVSMKPMSTRTGAQSRKRYELQSNERDEFSEFWRSYKDKLNTESDDNTSKSIRRFNEMYRKTNIEDRVVDCAIALEGTLLQDVSPGSSITFRMMLRSGLLLDEAVRFDRKTVRELFKSIYAARGDIVHKNSQLEEVIEKNDIFELDIFDKDRDRPDDFVEVIRTLLARVLLRYIQKEVDEGKSVAEVNQEIDTAALNAEYQ